MSRAAHPLVVADAGPLIGLAAIGAHAWLKVLFGGVIIPESVATELRLESAMPGAKALQEAVREGWLKVVPVHGEIPAYLETALDQGEAAAIMLAKQTGARLLIDEHRGRTAARREGVAVFGSGAVLLKAKQRKMIPEVRPYLDALSDVGYRLSGNLLRELLRLAGELR